MPLIANWPGRIPEGQINGDLIAFSDFFPTIVEAAGLPPKKITDADGWSFWPQCEGKKGKPRDWVYGYYFPRPYSKKYDGMYNHWEVRYARDERYKLYDNGELYDTQEDVLEKTVVDRERSSGTVKRVRKKLQAVLDSYPKKGIQVDYSKVEGVYAPKQER